VAIAFVTDWHQAHAEVPGYDVTVPVGAGTQGHTIIMSTVCSTGSISGTTATDDKGNTYLKYNSLSNGGAVLGVACLYVYLANGLTPLVDQIHLAFSDHLGGDVYFSEWSGLAPASFDKTSSTFTSFNTAYTSGATAATTTANELLFGATGTRHVPLTLTPDAPWVQLLNIDNDTDCMHVVQYRIVAATGAYASTGTINTDSGSIGIIGTFAQGADTGDTQPRRYQIRRRRATSW
jgi:hypothetical protein